MQTSCHRCPSALHNRLVTSTPSLSPLSLIHHVRFDASSGPLAARALPRARSREPRPSREKRWRGHWPGRGGGIPVEEKRVVDHGDSGARSRRWRTGPVARGPVASRKKRTYHRYAVAARKCYVVSLNYPQKKTPPSQSLAQLRPVDRLHAHRLELRRVRAPHHPQDHVGPDLRLLDER